MGTRSSTSGEESLEVAESSREGFGAAPSPVAELFRGRFRWRLLSSYPTQDEKDEQEGDAFLSKLKTCLEQHVDPERIDAEGVYPEKAIRALARLGAFGMKIPKEYGGLGLSVVNYIRCISYVSTYCASTAVWLSAHQSIGVPQPLKLFGTEAQKKKYLPRLAKGSISAFALTEPEVGSDPARMTTTAKLSADGKHYILNGVKQWCTNGPSAEIILVMALTAPKRVRGKERKQISAFIVETASKGFSVLHECNFMGIRGISNGILQFKNVQVPVDNRIGQEGEGLKIAFVTLNAGRLAVPACSAAAGKWCLKVSREWSKERIQWGVPIGEHQAISQKLASMAANTFAMESVAMWAAFMEDEGRLETRIEAALAKYFGSEVAWQIADDTLQIRGGRGYETGSSLRSRGEPNIPVERLLRDLRINRIIEGSSEIMQLFIAREVVDFHFQMAKPFLIGGHSTKEKTKAFGRMLAFYVRWYPMQWVRLPSLQKTQHLNAENKRHLRFIRSATKRLSRSLFHLMLRFGPKLDKQQLLLAHHVDIATKLFTMAIVLSRTDLEVGRGNSPTSLQRLCSHYCSTAREGIRGCFGQIASKKYKSVGQVGRHLLNGDFLWLEKGVYFSELRRRRVGRGQAPRKPKAKSSRKGQGHQKGPKRAPKGAGLKRTPKGAAKVAKKRPTKTSSS